MSPIHLLERSLSPIKCRKQTINKERHSVCSDASAHQTARVKVEKKSVAIKLRNLKCQIRIARRLFVYKNAAPIEFFRMSVCERSVCVSAFFFCVCLVQNSIQFGAQLASAEFGCEMRVSAFPSLKLCAWRARSGFERMRSPQHDQN